LLYDGDLEEAEGLPENALKLKALMSASGIPHCLPRIQQFDHPLLKNAIDWASRPEHR